MGRSAIDMTRRKVGAWEVLSLDTTTPRGKTNATRWWCLCTGCDRIFSIAGYTLRHKSRPPTRACISCTATDKDRWYESLELDEQGLTFSEIGLRMGVTAQQAHRLCGQARKDRQERRMRERDE